MARTGDFILVHFLDELPTGRTWQRRRNEWPLHVTLIPWFGFADKAKLIQKLEETLRNVRPFSDELGQIEHFGNDAVVTVLKSQSAIMSLHLMLLDVLLSLRVQLTNGRWIQGSYKAHVTHHVGMSVPETGEPLAFSTVSLVSLQPMNQCCIERHFKLGSTP